MSTSRSAGRHRKQSRRRGWLGVVALTVVGLALAGTGVFASWVATTSATTGAVNTAQLGLTYSDTNGTTFNSGVSNMLPGDYLYRYADLSNTGGLSETFSATVSGSGAITAAGGLQITVDKCSVAWAGNGSCSGTTTNLVTTRDVATAGTVTLDTIAGSGADHLRYKFTLNSLADVSFQGTSGSVTVSISGSSAVSGGQDRTSG